MSLLERYLLIALSLASNMLLARLLTPEQIGIYSVSLAVIGIAQVLRDFGIGNFLIQEKNLTDDHIRTAFGLSLLISITLFLLVFFAAPWAGRFYGEPRMVDTLRISSLNFLVLPFCSISLALLRRDMQFQRLLYVTLVATLFSLVITVGLAYAGFGANSMAIGALAGNIATGIGTWLARGDRRLLLWPNLVAWRVMLNFGGQSAATSVITTISMDANDLVVGKVLGFQPVAMLSRAQGLMHLFNRDLMDAIRNVALPAFSAAHRRTDDVESIYARSMSLITVIAWPFYGLVSLYALETLRLLFGAQWDAAASLVPWFCAAGACSAINALTPTLLVAVGRIDLVTRVELLMQPMRLALIVVAAVVFRTVEACAAAYLLSALIALPVFQYFKKQGVATVARATRRNLGASLVVSVATIAPALVHVSLEGFVRAEPIALPAVLGVIGLSLGLGLITAWALKHPIAQEPMFLGGVRVLSRIVALRTPTGR